MNYDKLTKEEIIKILDDTLGYIDKQEKEIERLNNIINELAFIFDDYNEFNKILEKYNYELKGSDK